MRRASARRGGRLGRLLVPQRPIILARFAEHPQMRMLDDVVAGTYRADRAEIAGLRHSVNVSVMVGVVVPQQPSPSVSIVADATT